MALRLDRGGRWRRAGGGHLESLLRGLSPWKGETQEEWTSLGRKDAIKHVRTEVVPSPLSWCWWSQEEAEEVDDRGGLREEHSRRP